jgi:4'-phosphopantetheinyl transferase
MWPEVAVAATATIGERRGTLRPTIGGNVKASSRSPEGELHLWHARLDGDGRPEAGALPAAERERAARLVRPEARRRWVGSRWALRRVLGHYLEREPADIELRLGHRGKPHLVDRDAALRFNLSHSGELALIAVVEGLEVGVDVQRLGPRPAEFYADWTQREAIAKCHGVGLWAPLPDAPVTAAGFDAGTEFAAAVAVGGDRLPRLRHLTVESG